MSHQLGGSIPPVSSINLILNSKKGRNGCIEWYGHINTNGYGIYFFEGKKFYVHRLMWMVTNNELLGSKEFICHRCDNRRCINPDHLFRGDWKTNNQDMFAKDRNVVVVSNGSKKRTICFKRRRCQRNSGFIWC